MSEQNTPRFAIFATLIATVIILAMIVDLAMIVASIAAGSVRQPPVDGGLPADGTAFTHEGHTCVRTNSAMQCWETP